MPATQFNQRSQADREDREAYLIGLDLASSGHLRLAPGSHERRPQKRHDQQQRQTHQARRIQQSVLSVYGDNRTPTSKRRMVATHVVGAPRVARRDIGRRGWGRRLTFMLLIGVCLAALGGLPAWALTSPTWRVRHIIIQGTHDPAVIAQIKGLPLANCDIFRCNLARDARLILASPLIAQASVTPQYPATLVISLRLRHVALLWRVGALTLAFGADGVAMGAVSPNGMLALDPSQRVATTPTMVIVGLSEARAEQIAQIDENLIEMAAQLRLPVIVGLLNLTQEAITLAYHWADGQGFVATTSGLKVVFGGPAAAAALAHDMANPGDGSAAPTGAPPTTGEIAQGVRLQLATLRGLLAWLAQTGQSATLIDLRWGAYPYYLVAR